MSDTEKLEAINDALWELAEGIDSSIDSNDLDSLTYTVARAMGLDVDQFYVGPRKGMD